MSDSKDIYDYYLIDIESEHIVFGFSRCDIDNKTSKYRYTCNALENMSNNYVVVLTIDFKKV